MFKIDQLVTDFSKKVFDGESEKERMTNDFLKSSYNILHEAQVWSPTCDQMYFELTAVYNYIVIQLNSSLCGFQACTEFNVSTTNEILQTTLHRVYRCICNENTTSITQHKGDISNETISSHLWEIVKILENPVFHFRSLNILGRLLLLVTAVGLYRQHFCDQNDDVVSCFVRLTEIAGVPVLKEKCHFHRGLLTSPSMSKGGDDDNEVFVEDIICLVLVTFRHPYHRVVMSHQPWKWLFTIMECYKLIEEKSFATAMGKLEATLKLCHETEQKCRLLCVFAECYFHLGCPQLAIQTYRDALHMDNTCFSILYHLSLVYRSLNLPDLELESLNLCVMAFAEKEKGKKGGIPLMEVDELIWSVHPPTPPVSYVTAKAVFAKSCLQLKRYPEAAEQYSGLIKMLQQEDIYVEFEKHQNSQQLNIAEILVEAAEVLLITRQFQECITICNHTHLSLSVDDTFASNSMVLDEFSDEPPSLEDSHSDLFHPLGNLEKEEENNSMFFNPRADKMKRLSIKSFHSDKDGSQERSRKRLRSVEMEERFSGRPSDDVKGESFEEILMTRLLLCKADALVQTAGITDQAVSCLQQAMDILLHHQFPPTCKMTQPVAKETLDEIELPISKRQRIDSAGKASSSEKSNTAESNLAISKVSENAWTKLLTDCALRMAKASWKRKRFSSVINSCRLVEQLDQDNVNALFLKTEVFAENNALKRDSVDTWLKKRGISLVNKKKLLEESVMKLQQISVQEEKNGAAWWTFCEKEFLELDIKCLRK